MKKAFPLRQILCQFSAGQRTTLGLTRSLDDASANVISVNVETGSKSVVQLKDVGGKKIICFFGKS